MSKSLQQYSKGPRQWFFPVGSPGDPMTQVVYLRVAEVGGGNVALQPVSASYLPMGSTLIMPQESFQAMCLLRSRIRFDLGSEPMPEANRAALKFDDDGTLLERESERA